MVHQSCTAEMLTVKAWGETPQLVSALRAVHNMTQGYQKASSMDTGMDTLKWGTDYLLRTLAKQKPHDGDKFPVYLIAYQVGNYTLDNSRWERPEMIKDSRPVYYVTTRNGEC